MIGILKKKKKKTDTEKYTEYMNFNKIILTNVSRLLYTPIVRINHFYYSTEYTIF